MARDLPSTSVFKTGSTNNKEEEKGTQLSVVEGGQDQQTPTNEASATVETPIKEEEKVDNEVVVTEKPKTPSKPKSTKSTPKKQQKTLSLEEQALSLEERIERAQQAFENRKKPTMEETHIRRSYLINRVLDAEFDKMADMEDRGWKTATINEALKLYLEHLKKTNDKYNF
ncbi:hypothetical protein [Priestia megaterium]|uniref:hypothetical protein n=1 Tax=Priestia megaterium TaxID=1404 RepID=UPI000BFD7B4C|nr:hypothetical protein [Priestia megaterium]PGO60757.1 hypothetical protein CN981_09480 [Priestia megaterium]